MFQKFENFKKKDIIFGLKKAEKNGDIIIKSNIKSFIDYFNPPKRDSFEYFIQSKSLSISDYINDMTIFLNEFDKLGLDTTKARKLYSKVQKLFDLDLHKIDDIRDKYHFLRDFNFLKKDDLEGHELEKIYKEIEKLEPFKVKFDKEIKKLKNKAIKIYYDYTI